MDGFFLGKIEAGKLNGKNGKINGFRFRFSHENQSMDCWMGISGEMERDGKRWKNAEEI